MSSDPLKMSLDDIIKKQKNNKKIQSVGTAKGKRGAQRVRGGNKAPATGTTRGKVSRNFTFKGKAMNSQQKPIGFSPTRGGRGGRRYFNATTRKGPNTNYNWKQVNSNFVVNNTRTRRNRPRPQRRQQNQVARGIEMEYQSHPLDRTVRRIRNKPNQLKSPRRFNWQGKFTFAQKSINRARQMLMRQRIMQNNKFRGNYLPTRRIVVGQYGLVTTQHQNLRERQALIQQKIQKARRIREQYQMQGREPIESMVFNRSTGLQQRRRRNRNATPPQSWSPSPFTSNRNTTLLRQEVRVRGRPPTALDDWDPPLMTARNTGRQASGPSRPTLDPNIQRKIQYIQQQGRRNRGEERRGQVSNRYLDDEDEDGSNFQPTIITSRMSLSDRFKSFMGT